MDDSDFTPDQKPISFLIGFVIGVSLLFVVLTGTVENFLLFKNAHTAVVLEVLDFEPEIRTRDDAEPAQSEIRIRDTKSGKVTTQWVDGVFKAGETINVASSARDGNYVMDVSAGKLRGNLVIALVVGILVVGVGRIGGLDAIYYLLGPKPRTYPRRFLMGALAVSVALFLAVVVTASWNWPYEFYSRYRALCAAGLAVMALGTWNEHRNSKVFAGCCAILAVVFVVASFPKPVWNVVNLFAAFLAAFAGLVALALLWPYAPKPER